jgi:hypothetical protein
MTNISLGQCFKDKFTTQLSSKDSLLADSIYYKLINHAIKFSTEPDTCGGAFDEDIIVYHQSKVYGSDATANSYLIRYNYKTPNIFFLQEKYWAERHTITIPCVYSNPKSIDEFDAKSFTRNFNNVFFIQKFSKDIRNYGFLVIIKRNKMKNILAAVISNGRDDFCFIEEESHISVILFDLIKKFPKRD